MQGNLITPANVVGSWDPATFHGHHIVLAPLLAIHAAAKIRRLDGRTDHAFHWEWAREARTREALEVIWNMTGRWNARRSVTMDRHEFDERVLEEVPSLAEHLNGAEVTCLRDLAGLNERSYRSVVDRIHRAVGRLSSLRRTKQVEPVLGSKVLHHYFPSIIPVFDTRFIRNLVMRMSAFRDTYDDWREWRIFSDEEQAGGASMFDFHKYFAFCAWQVGTAAVGSLHRTRARFARGFQHAAPMAMVLDRNSLLWRMDAKIAEYCAVNSAP